MKAIPELTVDTIARKLQDKVREDASWEYGEAYLPPMRAREMARDLIDEICAAVLDGAPRLEVHETGKHCPQDRRQFEKLDLGVYGLVYLGEADG